MLPIDRGIGHKIAGKKPDESLSGRYDSFVVETNVHYPKTLTCCQILRAVWSARSRAPPRLMVCRAGASGNIG